MNDNDTLEQQAHDPNKEYNDFKKRVADARDEIVEILKKYGLDLEGEYCQNYGYIEVSSVDGQYRMEFW